MDCRVATLLAVTSASLRGPQGRGNPEVSVKYDAALPDCRAAALLAVKVAIKISVINYKKS